MEIEYTLRQLMHPDFPFLQHIDILEGIDLPPTIVAMRTEDLDWQRSVTFECARDSQGARNPLSLRRITLKCPYDMEYCEIFAESLPGTWDMSSHTDLSIPFCKGNRMGSKEVDPDIYDFVQQIKQEASKNHHRVFNELKERPEEDPKQKAAGWLETQGGQNVVQTHADTSYEQTGQQITLPIRGRGDATLQDSVTVPNICLPMPITPADSSIPWMKAGLHTHFV